MLAGQQGSVRPKMRDVLLEASRALANIDADRLEELALSCHALNREQKRSGAAACARVTCEALDSRQELTLLGSILEATQANLRVLRHLRAMHAGIATYADRTGRN